MKGKIRVYIHSEKKRGGEKTETVKTTNCRETNGLIPPLNLCGWNTNHKFTSKIKRKG